MASAKRLAFRRFAYAVAGLALPFVAGLARGMLGGGKPINTIVALSALLGVMVFVWAIFGWRPKCPHCGVRARFVRVGDAEHLKCAACGFDELTGWGYD